MPMMYCTHKLEWHQITIQDFVIVNLHKFYINFTVVWFKRPLSITGNEKLEIRQL